MTKILRLPHFLFASIWLEVTSCSKIVFSNFVSSIWSSWSLCCRDTCRVCVADLLPQQVWGRSWPLASTCHRADQEPSSAPSGLHYPWICFVPLPLDPASVVGHLDGFSCGGRFEPQFLSFLSLLLSHFASSIFLGNSTVGTFLFYLNQTIPQLSELNHW